MKFNKKDDGTYELDVKGYTCPYPLLHFKKSLEKMNSGEVVEVVLDYPTSMETIGAECKREGHEVLDHSAEGGLYTLKIKKA